MKKIKTKKIIKKNWAELEFANVDLGDERLNNRLIKIADKFAEAPESPINQACGDWSSVKAAYRFFKNEGIPAASFGPTTTCQPDFSSKSPLITAT